MNQKKTKHHFTFLPLCLSVGLLLSACSKEEDGAVSDLIAPSISTDSSGNSSLDSGNISSLDGVNTSADEMRLEGYTGSLSLQNLNQEKAVVLGSRLVTGDNIETFLESNAHVVLDKAKLLRVNEISQIEIQQEHKNLDIHLEKGTVFFNVTSPLTSEETLEFHTSNVIAGVRGTSGIIHYDTANLRSQIVLLTGEITATTVSDSSDEGETQTIEAGQIAIVETHADGTVTLTIYELEEEDPLYYFPDLFIDGMQGDLGGEGDSISLSELVREPDEIGITGKVLSNLKVLAVEDENGVLHTFDNVENLENVSTGSIVNLSYTGNTVSTIEEVEIGIDMVGILLNLCVTGDVNGNGNNSEPMGQWENTYDGIIFYNLGDTDLSEAEKEAFLLRVRSAYINPPDIRLGSHDDLVAEAEALGVPLRYEEGENEYANMRLTTLFPRNDAGAFLVLTVSGQAYSNGRYGGGANEYTVVENSVTGELSSRITNSAG